MLCNSGPRVALTPIMREQRKTAIPGLENPSLGQLFIGGDWASAHGDFETLEYIARSIAELTPEPMRQRVTVLARRCAQDPEHAVDAWVALKDHVACSS